MSGFPWEIVLAVLGVLIPLVAFMWEFVFVGRKRLGYSVQTDTTPTNAQYAGAWLRLLQENGQPFEHPSFVLLRIENNGATNVAPEDYAVLTDDKVGIQVTFPGRQVAGMVVTEFSDAYLSNIFGPNSGLAKRSGGRNNADGIIELPKVPLNRGQYYKVLAALEGAPNINGSGDDAATFARPQVDGGIRIRGGDRARGRIEQTQRRIGTPKRTVALTSFLVAIIVGLFIVTITEDSAPLDCASGSLTVVGSTAFAPVITEAARTYADTCPEARFSVTAEGSGAGLTTLNDQGRQQGADGVTAVTFSDGLKPGGFPQLLPRPIAFSLFTLVINKQAGVQDLKLDAIRKIYDGAITNWKQLGGNDRPIRLISRNPDSGTRKTFQNQVLNGKREPGSNSDDCRTVDPGAESGIVRCERGSTTEVLNTVENTAGAMGYSELAAATARAEGLSLVRISGQQATLEAADAGAYPFWETEYAYTYGEPEADSLTASFLRYLTNEVGKDIIRSFGNRPCAELENPVLCRPINTTNQ